jgi:hypothetical protein
MAGDFKPTDAATSVFTFIKTYPKFVVRYVIFTLAAILPFFGYIAYLVTAVINNIGLEGEKWEGVEPFFAMLKQINALPLLVAVIVFSFAISISNMAMAIRKAVLNQEIGFWGLTWGGFENRLAIVSFAISFLPMLLLWPLFSIFGTAGDLDAKVEALLVPLLFMFLFFLFYLPFSVYAIGRWGLYGICALREGNFGIKASAELSKGRFWSLFGGYALTYLIWVVISGIFQNIGSALIGFQSILANDPSELSSFLSAFTPELLGKLVVFYIVLIVIGALSYLAYICTGAFAYLKIKQAETAPTTVEEAK